jgi:hypothetical protein
MRSPGAREADWPRLNLSNKRATSTVAYQDLISGKSGSATLLDNVKAFEKLGVTEGTLA